MKKMYLLVIMVVVLGLGHNNLLIAQGKQQGQKNPMPQVIEKAIAQNSNQPSSLFVNIIPDTACIFLNESFDLTGQIEGGGYTSVQWINNFGFGYFSDETILETQYFPGTFDAITGEVLLIVYVSDGIQTVFDMVVVKVFENSAGENTQICAGQSFQTQPIVSYYETLQWTTSGDGMFDDPTILSAIYTPGENDISAGWVQLTLTDYIGSPCNISGSSSFDLYIISPPFLISDLEDMEVEFGQPVTLSIVADNATGYQWYGPNGMIEGEVSPEFVIFSATFENAGQYYCEYYNECGNEVSGTMNLTVFQLQSITFPSGWSGISSWVSPFDSNIENLFQPVVNELVVLQNNSGTYNPSANINTLELWDSQSGYQVKFDAPVSLAFKGLLNENQTLTLNPGWNYLPVISSCDVDVASVFVGQASVEMIKEIAGLTLFWPELNIFSLQTLIPGKAYMIYVNSETVITFPTCTQ